MHCFLYYNFGIKCALCGLTRSFCSLAHGNLHESLTYHILGPAIFIFVCLQIPYRIYALVVYPKAVGRKPARLSMIVTAALAAALLINWLIYIGGLVL